MVPPPDRQHVSCAVACVARCMSYIGIGTSLLSMGILFLLPSLSTHPAPDVHSAPRRRRRLSPSRPDDMPRPRRRITLPAYDAAAKSCLTPSLSAGRHVTFQDLSPLTHENVEHAYPSPESIEDLGSSSCSASSNTAYVPSSPRQLSIILPDHLALPSPTHPIDNTPTRHRRRHSLSSRLPRVSSLFPGKRRTRPAVENCENPLLLEPALKPPKKFSPFPPLLGRSRPRSLPSSSAPSTPSLSPDLGTTPLPSPASSRTEPYGAPYFATPPTSSSEPAGRKRRVIVKRRSASADFIWSDLGPRT